MQLTLHSQPHLISPNSNQTPYLRSSTSASARVQGVGSYILASVILHYYEVGDSISETFHFPIAAELHFIPPPAVLFTVFEARPPIRCVSRLPLLRRCGSSLNSRLTIIRMDQLATFYPSLSQRRSIPAWYLPITFSLTLLPFIFVQHRRLAIALTSPIIVALCTQAPSYTFGDPSSDYYNSGVFLAVLLWYLDFAILTPATGRDAPVFRGNPQQMSSSGDRQENIGEAVEELPLWKRIVWALRLMLPSQRGIGWNWQVRGVPADSHDNMPRWTRVMIHLRRVVVTYVRSAILLVAMGFVTALQKRTVPPSAFAHDALNAAVGWSGALWVWDRLICFYSLAAAACIAIGLSDLWEWPPLMGDIRDAWSVRQMWR